MFGQLGSATESSTKVEQGQVLVLVLELVDGKGDKKDIYTVLEKPLREPF